MGHVNRMESNRKVSQLSNKNPQVSQLKGRPTTEGGTAYKQILVIAKLETGKRG
jgi:hypothetical protein